MVQIASDDKMYDGDDHTRKAVHSSTVIFIIVGSYLYVVIFLENLPIFQSCVNIVISISIRHPTGLFLSQPDSSSFLLHHRSEQTELLDSQQTTDTIKHFFLSLTCIEIKTEAIATKVSNRLNIGISRRSIGHFPPFYRRDSKIIHGTIELKSKSKIGFDQSKQNKSIYNQAELCHS